ncbi:MAG: tetratricopeptide repeat protein [Sedimentisphaeraceae bacterium JB056]
MAIDLYLELLEYNVIKPYLVYKHLGQTYYWNKDYDKAEIALRKSLELGMEIKRHDPELYYLLGSMCIKQGEYQDALMFFDKAVKYGKTRKHYKLLFDIDNARDMQTALRENEDKLPYLSAYFKQNIKRTSGQQ